MQCPLDKLTIKGYKSIQDMDDFVLGKTNILIGANGSGKSNLIDFFRMLRAMADGKLSQFVIRRGGGDAFFYNGPKETSRISSELRFGKNGFRFSLEPTADNAIMVLDQATYWEGSDKWYNYSDSGKESLLSTWKGDRSYKGHGQYLSVPGHIYEAVSSWIVYHVHDTGTTAPMRREATIDDNRELTSDASNIAPFLYAMLQDNPSAYRRIRETIQLVAPFFDDFMLDPKNKGENVMLKLEWRQKGSSFPFQPWQFSDGTIRFICLATALLQPSPPSTILIDEPELGLHPVALGVLSSLIHEISRDTQIIVSTQSPLLLNNFEAEDIVVVEREGNASLFRRLDPDLLDNWLNDYSLSELVHKNIIESGPSHA
jgi:predicted ATPase